MNADMVAQFPPVVQSPPENYGTADWETLLTVSLAMESALRGDVEIRNWADAVTAVRSHGRFSHPRIEGVCKRGVKLLNELHRSRAKLREIA